MSDRKHYIAVTLITAIIVYVTLGIISAVYNAALAEESHKPTWQPPAIQNCDLPLWERIRMECDGPEITVSQ